MGVIASMGVLAWIVLGGLAGWVGSMITGTNKRMGVVANVLVGVVGAVIGGWVFSYFGNYGVTGFNLYSFGVALVGSCILLSLAKIVMK